MPTDDTRTWRAAVIPTRGDRPQVLSRCLDAILPQVHLAIVIDNGDAPTPPPANPQMHHIWEPEQPPNLSRLWNVGLRAADHWLARQQDQQHRAAYTAVLNDDAIVPPYWYAELTAAMESASAVAGGYNGDMVLHKRPGTTPLHQRMPGHAFLLRRTAEVYADERLRWWCGDNDIDMQSRVRGGTLILPGDPVAHLHPDQSTTGVLAQQTALDMACFVAKWSFRPW